MMSMARVVTKEEILKKEKMIPLKIPTKIAAMIPTINPMVPNQIIPNADI